MKNTIFKKYPNFNDINTKHNSKAKYGLYTFCDSKYKIQEKKKVKGIKKPLFDFPNEIDKYKYSELDRIILDQIEEMKNEGDGSNNVRVVKENEIIMPKKNEYIFPKFKK